MVKVWEEQPFPFRTTIKHVQEMQDHIERVTPLVYQHMLKAQAEQGEQLPCRTLGVPAQRPCFLIGPISQLQVPGKVLSLWRSGSVPSTSICNNQVRENPPKPTTSFSSFSCCFPSHGVVSDINYLSPFFSVQCISLLQSLLLRIITHTVVPPSLLSYSAPCSFNWLLIDE